MSKFENSANNILNQLVMFKELDPNVTERENNIKSPAVILIYLMRIVAGLAFIGIFIPLYSTVNLSCDLWVSMAER